MALSLAGCAGGGATIKVSHQVSHLSPILYETLECGQVAGEASVLSAKASRISGVSNTDFSKGKTIYWPVALRLPVKGKTSPALGRLKYQFEALEKASQRENCKFQFKGGPGSEDLERKSAQSSWVTKIS